MFSIASLHGGSLPPACCQPCAHLQAQPLLLQEHLPRTSASYWAKNDIPTYPKDPQKDQKGAYCSVLFYHVLSWSCESCWVVSVASRIGKDKAAQRCQNPQPLPVPRIPPSLASAPKALQWTCAVLVSIGTVHKNENPRPTKWSKCIDYARVIWKSARSTPDESFRWCTCTGLLHFGGLQGLLRAASSPSPCPPCAKRL